MTHKAIFLDRDGTLNEEVSYLYRPEELRLLPGVPEALASLKRAGFLLFVVTNQAGIARGYYTEADCVRLHTYMNQCLAQYGAQIDAFYYCPHHPEAGLGSYRRSCSCRKPGTGMLAQAEAELEAGRFGAPGDRLDREHSFMLGDKCLDAEAGRRFGLRTVLLGTGYGAQERAAAEAVGHRPYDEFFNTMEEALPWIFAQANI